MGQISALVTGTENADVLNPHPPRDAKTPSRNRQWRRWLRVTAGFGVLAVPAALVLFAAPASVRPASANDWPWPVHYKQVAVFPTWGIKSTKFCMSNLETKPGKYAMVRVAPAARPRPVSHPKGTDDVYARPGQTTCVRRNWAGAPIFAKNLSPTRATVRMAVY